MAKKKSKLDLDLNRDGVVDAKDKSLAAKVLATKLPQVGEEVKEESPVEEVKEGDRIAKKDISRMYRKGDVVPAAQIAKWKECGIDYEVWF